MWLLRLGLYELQRPKECADDWIWILDHTIQVGKAKCFVVVGVRACVLNAKRLDKNSTGALEHQDLSVWKVELVEKSDGPTVAQQLRTLCETTGQVPKSVISDCGGDLSAGVAEFVAENPTIAVKDLPHFAANAVKKELNDDPRWAAFLADANRSKTQLRQTNFAFLLPPDLKTKARWMNLDPLITWSEKVLQFVRSPKPVSGVTWEDQELQEKMGWILRHQSSLQSWAQMLDVVGACLKYIRKHGYHRAVRDGLQNAIAEVTIPQDSPARRVANRIIDYAEEQSRLIPEGEHLLATTEVMESLLGKAKQLQRQQSKSGFTKMILGIAASVTNLTTEFVRDALSTIRVRDVAEWIANELGTSVQGQRYQALHKPSDGTNPA
jgi:hypothetical protein